MKSAALAFILLLFCTSQSWAALCGLSCLSRSYLEEGPRALQAVASAEQPPCHKVLSPSEEQEGLSSEPTFTPVSDCFHQLNSQIFAANADTSYKFQVSTPVSPINGIAVLSIANLHVRWVQQSQPPSEHKYPRFLLHQSFLI